MGQISAELIRELLKYDEEFIKLEFGKNNLMDEGVLVLSELLATNKNLIHLDISSNNITEKGVKYLTDVLVSNKTLVSLSLKSFEGLNRNKIGQKGCEHLKKLLTKTKVKLVHCRH